MSHISPYQSRYGLSTVYAKYIILILFTTIVSFSVALLIKKSKSIFTQKIYLGACIIINIGVLFFFKYFNFFVTNTSYLLEKIVNHPVSWNTLDIILPVGISFYTFQTLSYVIDVYRGDVEAETHLGKFATFISFFPQLVAGPIERTSNLLPQIKKEHTFNYEKATDGLKIMAWGFFKKIIIADTLAIQVDRIYGNLRNYRGGTLVIAAIFFAIQIYCDFSGYSDIAVGTAKLFDIDLMQNFKSPYFSGSVKEFWSRWHISLSSWLRDYLYIPLGGNRCSKPKHCLNLMITFLASGLWHGANWTYVIWGGVHGLAEVAENLLPKRKKEFKVKHGIRWWCSVIITFTFCCIAWIFFRASTLDDAAYILSNFFQGIENPIKYARDVFYEFKFYIGVTESIKIIFATSVLFIHDYLSLNTKISDWIRTKNIIFRWSLYIILGLIIILLLPVKSTAEFIYFQF